MKRGNAFLTSTQILVFFGALIPFRVLFLFSISKSPQPLLLHSLLRAHSSPPSADIINVVHQRKCRIQFSLTLDIEMK